MESGVGTLRRILSALLGELPKEKAEQPLSAFLFDSLNPNAMASGENDLASLLRIVQALRVAVFQRMPMTKTRGVILGTLDQFEGVLGLRQLQQPLQSYANKNRQKLTSILNNLDLLDDVVPGDGINLDIPSFRIEIERLKASLGASTEIDANVRSLIVANLDLVMLSADRVAIEGVSELRLSVHCALGRLTLQLHDKSVSAQAVKAIEDTIDTLLRAAGAIELVDQGLGLLGYSGIAGLLTGPS